MHIHCFHGAERAQDAHPWYVLQADFKEENKKTLQELAPSKASFFCGKRCQGAALHLFLVLLNVYGFFVAFKQLKWQPTQILNSTRHVVRTAEFAGMLLLMLASLPDVIALVQSQAREQGELNGKFGEAKLLLTRSVGRFIVVGKSFNLLSAVISVKQLFFNRASKMATGEVDCHGVMAMVVHLLILVVSPMILAVKLETVAFIGNTDLVSWSFPDVLALCLLLNNLSSIEMMKLEHLGQLPLDQLKREVQVLALGKGKKIDDHEAEVINIWGKPIDVLEPLSEDENLAELFICRFSHDLLNLMWGERKPGEKYSAACSDICSFLMLALSFSQEDIQKVLEPVQEELGKYKGAAQHLKNCKKLLEKLDQKDVEIVHLRTSADDLRRAVEALEGT